MKQNRQKKYQRILAIVLCVLMVLGLFAGVLPAFAETAPQDMTAQKAAEQCTADGLSRYFDYIPKEGTALTFEELGNLYTSKTVPDMEQLMREAKKSNTPPKYLTEICKPNEGRMVLVYEDGSPAGLLMMQRDDAGVWRAIGSDADAARLFGSGAGVRRGFAGSLCRNRKRSCHWLSV